jgi:hypothetical protein
MKQKLFFLMLALLFLSVTSMNAQVQIGGTAGPNASAILDLNPDEGDATLGLKLPVIALGDVSVFQLSGTAENADGIMVYNSSEETAGGSGKGIYVWNGSKWNFAGKSGQIVPADIPVKNIKITSAGYVTELDASGAGSTLKLTATVEPAGASQEVIWSKLYSTATTAGDVTVDATGLVTGVKTGSVTVRATATDGSGVYRDLALVVKATGYVTGITITPVNGSSTVEVDKTLQLEATIEPLSAIQEVTWSTDNASVASVVSTTGLVAAVSEGSATITATAVDPSGVTASYPIDVVPSTLPPLVTDQAIIGGEPYKTYNFGGTVWTVENMRHLTPTYTYNSQDLNRTPEYYYTNADAQNLCTDGFAHPTVQQALALWSYLQSPAATPSEIQAWTSNSNLIGYVSTSITGGAEWGQRALWLVKDYGEMSYRKNNGVYATSDWTQGMNLIRVAVPVRCVQQ